MRALGRISGTDEMILPLALAGINLGAVLREIRLRGDLTRYQMEKATGQHYVAKMEDVGFQTVQLRTLLKWCEASGHEIVIRQKTRDRRVDPGKLRDR